MGDLIPHSAQVPTPNSTTSLLHGHPKTGSSDPLSDSPRSVSLEAGLQSQLFWVHFSEALISVCVVGIGLSAGSAASALDKQ